MIRMLCLDPGKTTGYARFFDSQLVSVGEVKKDEVIDWLFEQDCDLVVAEDYKVFPDHIKKGFKNTWVTPFSVEVLGMLKIFEKQKGIKVVTQPSSIKPMGYGFANMEYVKNKKGMHIFDAIAHGAYYLVKVKGVSPKSLQLTEH